MNDEEKKKILEKYEWYCCRYDLSGGYLLCEFFSIYYPKYKVSIKKYLHEEGIIDGDDPNSTIRGKHFPSSRDVGACLTFRYWVLEDFLDKVTP